MGCTVEAVQSWGWRWSRARLRSAMTSVWAMVRDLAQHNHLPDYSVTLDGDMVIFQNREALKEKPPDVSFPKLNPETYNDAKIVASGYDVYYLEQEWRDMWVDTGMPFLRSPDKAFIAFCKSRAKRRPMG